MDPVKFRMSSLLDISRVVESTDSIELIWRFFLWSLIQLTQLIKTSVFYIELFLIIADWLFICLFQYFFMGDLSIGNNYQFVCLVLQTIKQN